MSRHVYRSWLQSTLLTIVMATFLLISILAYTIGGIVAQREWFGLILYPIIGVSSIVGIWLAVRIGVVIDEQGIRLRNFGRGRRLPWDAIDHVDCGACDNRLMFILYAPVAVLVPEKSRQPSLFGVPTSSTRVAERIPLTVLGSYVEATAQLRAEQLVADLSIRRHLARPSADETGPAIQ